MDTHLTGRVLLGEHRSQSDLDNSAHDFGSEPIGMLGDSSPAASAGLAS